MTLENVLLGAGVLGVSTVLASRVSGRLGVPALLLFLAIGMLGGSEGLGGVEFDDYALAQAIAIVALVYILFAGGLQTRPTEARSVAGSAVALATVGVLLTALAMGLFAWLFLGLPPLHAILLGSIVASTDAAAVFALFAGASVRLRGRLRPLLEFESGSNDPMAVFLTVSLVALLTQPGASLLDLVPAFVVQMSVGGVVGYGLGRGGAWLINHVRLDTQGLYPVLTLTLALATYGLAASLGGNGFLAVYVAGLVLSSRDLLRKHTLVEFHDGLAWLMQIALFLTLGLLVFPSHLVPVIGQGLLASLFLMLVARPLSVFVTLAPSAFSAREKALISWVGLRGAVPIVLATFPLIAGVPHAERLFNLVFFIVLTSALLQGTTLVPLARWLGLEAPDTDARPFDPSALGPVAAQLREIRVPDTSPAAGRALVDLAIPRQALILLVFRGDDYVLPRGATVLEAGDRLLVLADDDALAEVSEKLCCAVLPPLVSRPEPGGSRSRSPLETQEEG